MTAYVGLAGVGAALAGGFNLEGARRLGEHPGLDIAEDLINLDIADLGGPPADMLLSLVHGNYTEAMEEVAKPTVAGRIERATEKQDLMELTGFRQ
jgi:hypothetical protein